MVYFLITGSKPILREQILTSSLDEIPLTDLSKFSKSHPSEPTNALTPDPCFSPGNSRHCMAKPEQAIFKRIMKFDFPNFCPKCCRGNLQGLFYKDLLSSNPSTSEQTKKDREGAYNASAISVHGPWRIVVFFFFFFLLIQPFNYFTAWPQLVWMLPEWPRQPHLKKVAFQH